MEHSFRTLYEDVYLQPLSSSDSEKYRLLRNRPDICKWFGYKEEISQEQQEKWYLGYLNNNSELMFSITTVDGQFVGCNSIYDIDRDKGIAEYGRLAVDHEFAGKGYGFQATMAAIHIAKEELGLTVLILEVYEENRPAIITYHRAGFQDDRIVFDDNGYRMISMFINLK